MENYETKLLLMSPRELSSPKGSIPFSDLVGLVSINSNDAYERRIRKLAKNLPYQTASWPSFGQYTEDWYKVEVSEFKRQLFYCERGSCGVRHSCENLIDLSYQIISIVSPSLTQTASKIAENLDLIKDQRLFIWLRMSSGIYHMLQVNKYFGVRMLNSNVTWMCEELVRMGIFKTPSDAFESEIHIRKGLMLSGLSSSIASSLYQELKNA